MEKSTEEIKGRQTIIAFEKTGENYYEIKTAHAEYLGWYDDGGKRFTFHRKDEKNERFFYDMQNIKNKVFGEEKVAVEVFPAQKDLIDGQSQTHLWLVETENLYNLKK